MPDRFDTPEELAGELLGRNFADLEPEEQRVLRRIASRTVTDPDADEIAAANASFGGRMADRVAAWGGSWAFIFSFALVLISWVLINSGALAALGLPEFDKYPYIFLNLMLSMLAAIQAPVILMSQNRQAQKDRITARHDYEVNLRAELEIIHLHRQIDRILELLEAREQTGSDRDDA